MAATVAVTVVVTPGPPPSLDLHGPLTPSALAAALALLPPCTPTLFRHSATHHTLTLPPPPYPAGPLSDLLTGAEDGRAVPLVPYDREAGDAGGAGPTPVRALPVTPLQRDVLLDALTHPGSGLHVEQLHWRWYGPLDTRRFTAAWQSLYDTEAVLRAALARPGAGDPAPLVVIHPYAAPRVERFARGSTDWHALLLGERLRAFDLHEPGAALRISVLEEPRSVVRVLLTYHQALLDGWSVRILQRALYRAYLGAGRPLGGERRPDVRDHMGWLAAQELGPARAFWTARALPSAGATTLPGRSEYRGSRRRGHGRTRQRLTSYEALRLRNWAAHWGATESTALHTAWALQLHRAASGTPKDPRATPHPVSAAGAGRGVVRSATPVTFAAAVSGRGITLAGAERLPGPLRSAVPVYVTVDPAVPVTHLLTTLTGRALDAAAYEWLAPGQFAVWAAGGPDDAGPDDAGPGTRPRPESLLAFDAQAPAGDAHDPVYAELAAEGVRVDPAESVSAHTALPYTVTAHHDAEGALVLTAIYDRGRIADSDAAETLAQTAHLLRELPDVVRESTTVAEALDVLAGTPVPRAAHPVPRPLRVLRRALWAGAGTICLIPPPGARTGCYDALAEAHPGPQALATVHPPADARTCLAALRPALARGEPLLLGGFSGAGTLAFEVAERIAAHGWHPPFVAIGGTADGGSDSVRALARTLETAAAAAGRHGPPV
ncbi:condensation domain-containing protein [Streptomyces sp. NPDC090022]|uniref:condensation domain-containing protein n=1 Tax=Streptomyces sp. NPDC090022 TaxID=3365920 RepID=UPI0038123F6C